LKTDALRFYFSFRSPYSWIGARLLRENVDHAKHAIEYTPFWDPDDRTFAMLKAMGGEFPYTPMSRQKHLYILQDIKRLTSKLGYKLAWPVDRDPWWELPHLGYLIARKQGKAMTYLDVVYRARWERGLDICACDNIAALAAEAGIDPAAVLAAPRHAAVREEGALALLRSYRDGVFGIPFYINGFQKFWGVDRFHDFLATLGSEPSLEPANEVRSAYGGDHPGGCG
jgi:2-hydroxychromene-2-carboxylate isomerase